MENVNRLLEIKGWTKQKLAKEIGTTRENLYRILNGNPTLDNLKKIASALDVPLWKLFTGSEDNVFGIIFYRGESISIESKNDIENLLFRMNEK